MKFIKQCAVVALTTLLFACQDRPKPQDQADPAASLSAPAGTDSNTDPRPKDETHFLEKVAAESDYDVTSNAVKKDAHIAAFNKYALDSLKTIKDWEFTVTEINDNSSDANSIIKTLGGPAEIYNLILVAPIKIDNAVDSIAIDNRVDFTYTTPKEPKNDVLKKIAATIKGLNKGDVVIVSGSLTHIDEAGKVNFASFYDDSQPWNVDLMLTDIKKKVGK